MASEYWSEGSNRQPESGAEAADTTTSDESSDKSSIYNMGRWSSGLRNAGGGEADWDSAQGSQDSAVSVPRRVRHLRGVWNRLDDTLAESPTFVPSLWHAEDSEETRSGGSTALRGDAFIGFAGADDSSAHNAETLHDVRGGDADEQYASAWAPRSRQQQQMTPENGVGADNQEGLESGEDGGEHSADLLADLLNGLAIEPPRTVTDPPMLRTSTPLGWYDGDLGIGEDLSAVDADAVPGIDTPHSEITAMPLPREIPDCYSNKTYYQPRENSFASSSSSSSRGPVCNTPSVTRTTSASDAAVAALKERVNALEAEVLVRDSEIVEANERLKHLETFLQCAICMETFARPHTLACGHVFCQTCLAPWLEHHKSCPTCRAPVGDRPAVAFAVQDIVDALDIGSKSKAPGDACVDGSLSTDPWSEMFPRDFPSFLGKFVRCSGCSSWVLETSECRFCSLREPAMVSFYDRFMRPSGASPRRFSDRAQARGRSRLSRNDATDMPQAQDYTERTHRLRDMVDRLRTAHTGRSDDHASANRAEQGMPLAQTTRPGARTLRRRRMSLSASPPESLFGSLDSPSAARTRSPPVRWVDPSETVQPSTGWQRRGADQATVRSPTSYQWHNPFGTRTTNRNWGDRTREPSRLLSSPIVTNSSSGANIDYAHGDSIVAELRRMRQLRFDHRQRLARSANAAASAPGSAARNPIRISHIFGHGRDAVALRNINTERRAEIQPTVSSPSLQVASSNAHGLSSRRPGHVPLTQLVTPSHSALEQVDSADSLLAASIPDADDAYGHQTQPAYPIHTEQPADNSPSDSEPNERVSSILDDIMTAHRPPESMDNIDYSYIYMRLRSIRDLTERARLEAEQQRQQEQDQQAAVTDQPLTARRSRAEHANVAGGQAAGELPRPLRRRATLERESAQSPAQQLSFSTFRTTRSPNSEHPPS